MTLRRKSREFALQMLFEWDMTRQEPKRVEKLFWKSASAADSTRKFANQLFEGAVAGAPAADKLAGELVGKLETRTARGHRSQYFAAGDL